MADDFSEQLLLLRADFTALNAMVKDMGTSLFDNVGLVNERMDQMGEQMHAMARQMATTAAVCQATAAQSRVALAESRERFNQLSGRMNLTENRMTAMLGAVDGDRGEWRALYRSLDERLTDVEKRLPPSD